MAKKKAAAKEVERKVLSNGVILIKYDDGSYAFLTSISAEDAEEIFGGESEDSDDEDEDERTQMTRTKTRRTQMTRTKTARRMKTPTKTKTARRMKMRMTK